MSCIRFCLYGVLGVVASMPASASAQVPVGSFAELQSVLKAGDEVRVTDTGGATTQGTVIDLSGRGLNLTVDGRSRTFAEATIRQLGKRRRDSPWNGVLIGAAIGTAAGAITKARNCGATDCGEGGLVDPGFYFIGAAAGAGVGALVDGAIKKFDVVFTAPPPGAASVSFAPLLSRQMIGVRVSVAF